MPADEGVGNDVAPIDCTQLDKVDIPVADQFCTRDRSTAVSRALATARAALEPVAMTFSVTENGSTRDVRVVRRSYGPLIYERDDIQANLVFYAVQVDDDPWRDYHVIAAAPTFYETGFPNFDALMAVPVRIDSACSTGQLFGDRTCECRDQLDVALHYIALNYGAIVAIPGQDGRGFGLDFKLATLRIQREAGLTTVEAARLLHGSSDIDDRTYGGAIASLRMLGLAPGTAIKLLTNNPDKMRALVENGYVIERVPLRIAPTDLTARHLEAKRAKLGHLL